MTTTRRVHSRREHNTLLQPFFSPARAEERQQPPHILMLLQDDLGWDDVAFNGNGANLNVTRHITAAAEEGIVLQRHYVHWHCSPSRRSFLTGRLPLHHHELLSDIGSDDIVLRPS